MFLQVAVARSSLAAMSFTADAFMPNRTSRYYELPRDVHTAAVRLASSAWCLARAHPHKQQPPHASRA